MGKLDIPKSRLEFEIRAVQFHSPAVLLRLDGVWGCLLVTLNKIWGCLFVRLDGFRGCSFIERRLDQVGLHGLGLCLRNLLRCELHRLTVI